MNNQDVDHLAAWDTGSNFDEAEILIYGARLIFCPENRFIAQLFPKNIKSGWAGRDILTLIIEFESQETFGTLIIPNMVKLK